jgi:hypothetical protein
MLNSKNLKLNKKKWKESGIQSCKKFTKLWVDNQVKVECLEEWVECLEEWEECLEEWEECLEEWEECLEEWAEWEVNNNQKPQM